MCSGVESGGEYALTFDAGAYPNTPIPELSTKDMHEFVSVEEARAMILASMPVLAVERVPLSECLGRTLAEKVVSREAIPPFDNSAMDGYAVRIADLEDLPAQLRIAGVIHAGSYSDEPLHPGSCVGIMTGAPIPPGADTVVPVEWTKIETDGYVTITRRPQPEQHVRRAGTDVRMGATLFEPGDMVTPPAVGMLAATGYVEVAVRVRPRVAIVATGDELVGPGEPLGPGQIRNSNGPALAAQAISAGAVVGSPLVARDEPADIRAVLERALEADVIVLSGGVSVGEHDFVKQVLDEMGMELLFWKVRQRPGKPLAFGILDEKPVFGLPGNPVSSAVCFEQYVRPALARMMGRTNVVSERHTALLSTPIQKAAGLYHFVRGHAFVDEQAVLRVRDTGPQASNVYSSVVQANCLIHLPEEIENPRTGTPVGIEWLRW